MNPSADKTVQNGIASAFPLVAMLEERLRWFPFEMNHDNRMFALGQIEMLAGLLGLDPTELYVVVAEDSRGRTGGHLADVNPLDWEAMLDAVYALTGGMPYAQKLTDALDEWGIESFRVPTIVAL
jgi:hypothetical protein